MVVPASLLAWGTGAIQAGVDYDGWSDSVFLVHFVLSCIMG